MPGIAEGVYFIPGQDESLPDSHTYILGDPSSQDLSLIDPGLVRKGNYKIESIKKLGIELKSIKRILMTHTHLDHIGCLSEIRKAIPQAELWMHTLEAEPLQKGDERTVYGMDMFKQLCQMQYGLKSGAFAFDVDRMLQGGENLDLGGMAWEILHIPGHSMGSIALYHSGKKILIPGDVVYADHAIGRFDLHGADSKELKKSLMRLAELEVGMLLPGHNAIVEKLPSGYIRKTAKQWESYLA
jgi:glyoxylase-like metal-dependent hydrolase (beta-lactamase superfamily II)